MRSAMGQRASSHRVVDSHRSLPATRESNDQASSQTKTRRTAAVKQSNSLEQEERLTWISKVKIPIT